MHSVTLLQAYKKSENTRANNKNLSLFTQGRPSNRKTLVGVWNPICCKTLPILAPSYLFVFLKEGECENLSLIKMLASWSAVAYVPSDYGQSTNKWGTSESITESMKPSNDNLPFQLSQSSFKSKQNVLVLPLRNWKQIEFLLPAYVLLKKEAIENHMHPKQGGNSFGCVSQLWSTCEGVLDSFLNHQQSRAAG